MEFTQKLQDMIGDLTGAPQPIDIMLFSPDAKLLDGWAPRVADAIGKIDVAAPPDRRRGRRHRFHHQRPGSFVSDRYGDSLARRIHAARCCDEAQAMLNGVKPPRRSLSTTAPIPSAFAIPPNFAPRFRR